jgi:hypothetical protein
MNSSNDPKKPVTEPLEEKEKVHAHSGIVHDRKHYRQRTKHPTMFQSVEIHVDQPQTPTHDMEETKKCSPCFGSMFKCFG